MPKPSPFSVELPKLREGQHHFEFAIAPDSFLPYLFPDEPPTPGQAAALTRATAAVEARLHRSTRLIDCVFTIRGTLHLACDRCAQGFDQPFEATERMVYSFEPSVRDQESDDVVYIEPDTHILDFWQDLYDFVALQTPYRQIPPGCPGPTCPTDILALIRNVHDEDDNLPQPLDTDHAPASDDDSPFAALRKLQPPSEN